MHAVPAVLRSFLLITIPPVTTIIPITVTTHPTFLRWPVKPHNLQSTTQAQIDHEYLHDLMHPTELQQSLNRVAIFRDKG